MMEKTFDYFGKFMKIFLLACFAVVDVISPITSAFASTLDSNDVNPYQKGDVVKSSVSAGSLTNPGDVQVVKTISKTDTLGRYNINFEIKGKKNVNTTNYDIYAVLVFDRSGSMICDSDKRSYSYEDPYSAGMYHTSYMAADGNTIYCSNSTSGDGKLLSNKWESAVRGGVNFSSTLANNLNTNPSDPRAYFSLVTFASDVSNASNWQNVAYGDSQFGHPYGATKLGSAINVAQNKLNSITDANAKKVMIIISDGEPENENLAKNAALNARNAGTTIYTIGYDTDAKAKRILEDIAGSSERYADADDATVSEKMKKLASSISESDAGINAVLTDTLNTNDFDFVSGDNGVSYSDGKITYDVGTITTEGTSFNFLVDIKGDTANGIVDSNNGFILNYESNGNKDVSTVENPSVYWEQNKYSYNVEYYYDDVLDSNNGYTVKDVIAGIKTTYVDKPKDGYVLKEVINNDTEIRDNSTVVQVKYEKIRNLSYKVEYYYDNVLDTNSSYPVNDVEYGTKTTYEDKLKEGYRFKEVINNETEVVNNDVVVKVYYEKIKDLSYEVKYYFDGVENENLSYTENNVEYGTSTKYKEVDYTGYYKVSEENVGIKVTDDKIIVKVYFEKIDDLSYKVEYFYDGTKDTDATYIVNGVEYGTEATFIDKKKTGYKLSKVENNKVLVKNNHLVVRVYYVKDTFNYTVKYYYDELLDDDATETSSGTYGDIINSYTDKVKEGYVLDRTENLPLTISEISDNNLINVYYRLRNDLGYIVEYYYDNAIDNDLTEIVSKVVYGTRTTYTDKPKEGYVFDTVTGNGIQVKDNSNVVRVYYKKINNLHYNVEYYFDGAKRDNLSYTEPDVVYGTRTSYKDVDHTGYYKVKEENVGTEVKDNNITVKVYFETIKDLNYKVEYYYDGVQDKGLTEIVTDVVYGSKTTYTDKVKEGYVFDKVIDNDVEVVNNDTVVKVYYKTINDLKYNVEYYYDGVIDTDNGYPVNDVTYGSKTTYVDKVKEGYRFKEVINNDVKVTNNNITVKVYYEYIKDLSYKVEYYYDGVIDNSKTYPVYNVAYGDKTTYVNKNKTGYKFSNVTNNDVAVKNNEVVVRVYYVKNTFNYTVKYYYDNILDEDETETSSGTYGDIINSYIDKIREGYVLDRTENLPLTISEISDNNLINVYYRLRNDLSYKVEYYYDGNIDDALTKIVDKVVYGSKTTYSPEPKTGYKFVGVTGNDVAVKNNDNVVRVYYKTIDDLHYNVEYYFDGAKRDSLSYTENDVVYGTKTSYKDVDYTGYYFERAENAGLEVTDDSITVRVYFKTINDLSYKVEYYFDGERDDSLTETITDVVYGTRTTYTDKIRAGYKFDKATDNGVRVIDNNTVVRVYYKTINDLKYNVEYYYDGVIDTDSGYTVSDVVYGSKTTYVDKVKDGYRLKEVVNNDVRVTDSNVTVKVYYEYIKDLSYKVEYYYDGVIDNNNTEVKYNVAYGDKTTYADKNKTGYKLSNVTNNNVTVKNSEIVVRVYYVKDTFNYTVKYYYDNILDKDATETSSGLYGDVIKSYTDKAREGYRLVREENLPLTISENGDKNIINIYYEIINDLSYKVEYYYDGDIDNSLTETITDVVYGTKTTYTDKVKAGYRFEKVEGNDVAVKNNDNVVRVYYKTIDDLHYNVEYYFDGVINDKLSYTETDVVYGTKTSYKDVDHTGYYFVNAEYNNEEVTNNNITVKVYFKTIDDLSYKVEYYYDGELDEDASYTENNVVYGTETTYLDKNKEGYKLDKVEGNEIKVVDNDSIVRVYYVRDSFKYTIEYYFEQIKGKGYTKDSNLTEEGEALYNDEINEYPDKVKKGYEFNSVEGMPLVIGTDEEDNVIRVYYNLIKSNVIVMVEDEDGNKLKDDETITGRIYDDYEVDTPVISGYTLVKVVGDTEGEYAENDKVVKFVYKKIIQEVAPITGVDGINGLGSIIGMIAFMLIIIRRREEA